jgi:hypothetical protein
LRQIANGKYKAIIVIRHADDNGPQDYIIKRSAKLPNGKTIEYTQKRLSKNGKAASDKYATVLPKRVNDLGLASIKRVIVKEPPTAKNNYSTSPNPFDTVYPFISVNNIMNVTLISSKYIDNFPNMDEGSGSVLICWDKEGMYENNYGLPPSKNSILYKLDKMYNVTGNISFPILGDYVVYVYDENRLRVYSFDMTKELPTYNPYDNNWYKSHLSWCK